MSGQLPEEGAVYVQSRTSTTAIISLIAGILGWTLLPLIGSIVAVITGHMARREIKESGGALTGDGFAVFGLVLGYASLLAGICAGCFLAMGIFLFPVFGWAVWSNSGIIPALMLLF